MRVNSATRPWRIMRMEVVGRGVCRGARVTLVIIIWPWTTRVGMRTASQVIMRVELLLLLSGVWPIAIGEWGAMKRLLDGWQRFGVMVLLSAVRVLLGHLLMMVVRTRTRRGVRASTRMRGGCMMDGRAGVRGESFVRMLVVHGRDLARGRQVLLLRRRIRVVMGSRGRDSSGRIQRH